MTDQSAVWPQIMAGRELYHAAPLHYLPSILQDRALYAKSVLAARGIQPRASARRRDNSLGLQDYVHFGFSLRSPLLMDKLAKGYAHAVLVFDALALARMPGHALLPFNTKAWRTRSACSPITDDTEKARLVRRRDLYRELRSLELLVKYAVGLENLTAVVFATPAERSWVKETCGALGISLAVSMPVDEGLAPPEYAPVAAGRIEAYFCACRRAGAVLPPPPEIPFD